jgi:hypothetical protein
VCGARFRWTVNMHTWPVLGKFPEKLELTAQLNQPAGRIEEVQTRQLTAGQAGCLNWPSLVYEE